MPREENLVLLFMKMAWADDFEKRLQHAISFRNQWEGLIEKKLLFNRSELPKFQEAILTKSEERLWDARMQDELHDKEIERQTQARQVIIDAGLAHLLDESISHG